MNCPKCTSDQTQTFKMAYVTGSASSQSDAPGVSGNVNSQTSLAKLCAPPDDASISGFTLILFLLLSAFLTYSLAEESDELLQAGLEFLLYLVILLVIRYFLYSKWANKTYIEEIGKWSKKWICLKCGAEFEEQNTTYEQVSPS
jgi:hypothetical protein